MTLIERANGYSLYWYPRAGWAVFRDHDGAVIINGKLENVLARYRELIA